MDIVRGMAPVVADDRDAVGPQDRVLLVVDNDASFARVMVDLSHEHGYKALSTAFGAGALVLARERQPDAITLDISLPDLDGWRVLDRLKHDLDTRHVPVFVITTDDERERAFALGAIGVLNKPVLTREQLASVFETIDRVTRRDTTRALAVLGGDAAEALQRLFADPSACLDVVATVAEARERLGQAAYDCLVADAGHASGAFDALPAGSAMAVAIHAPSGVSRQLRQDVRRQGLARPVRISQSAERLFDDVALLLHARADQLATEGRETLGRLYHGDGMLAGRKVLIVDDDIRNIFAMTSMLETHQMHVLSAENGKDGIEKLRTTPGIDIVLMDIMMPDRDGYDTMRAIRGIPECRSLPIVAVTAKAMKGDREKCIEAGAWDYVPKPVASDQLLAVLRTWLHR